MRYQGNVHADNLLSDSILNFVDVKAQTPAIVFEVGDDMVLAVAEELSRTLKPGKHLAVIGHEYEKMVIFPGKIFRFTPKEVEKRQKALDYAKSVGISESQINF